MRGSVATGNFYMELKQWDKAIADYSKAIELDPKNAWALSNRANIYSQLKQWDKAIADYTKAIELDPKNAWAVFNRANIYQPTEAMGQGHRRLLQSHRTGTEECVGSRQSGRIFTASLKQWDKAIDDYTKAIELDPKNSWALK